VVITEPFQTLVTSQARRLGVPGYHHVVVPHPISSKEDEKLDEFAASVSDVVSRQLLE
jgi:hypothetical protein